MFIRATPIQDSNPPTDARAFGHARFRAGKKVYAIIAVVAIVIIAVAFFIPQGRATIPLNVDFVVGEKMVYDSTLTMALQGYDFGSLSTGPSNISMDSQQTIEVVEFDGENYLLNHTTTMTLLGKPISISLMEKMNKTGYSTYLLNTGNAQTPIPTLPSSTNPTGNSYLAQLLNRPEAKVGETISVPYPSVDNSYIQTTGNLKITFNAVEDLTVPAGTFRAFRIDMTSDGLKVTLKMPESTSSIVFNDLSMGINLNAQIYLEYGTMRQIKSIVQETSSMQSSILNMTTQMSANMILKQDIKPS